jgi:hypothetical protein
MGWEHYDPPPAEAASGAGWSVFVDVLMEPGELLLDRSGLVSEGR